MAIVHLGEEGLSSGDEIDPYLSDYWQSGNTVLIPQGEYEWGGSNLGGRYSDAQLIGLGEIGGVVLRRPEGRQDRWTLRATGGTVRLKNITMKGAVSNDDQKVRVEAYSGAELILEHFMQPDGQVANDINTRSEASGGIYMPGDSPGTIHLKWCWVEGFGDNGAYLDGNLGYGENGPIHILGGLYKNNNITSLRIGTHETTVHRATIVQEELPDLASNRVQNMRGLRVRQPGQNISITDTHIIQTVGSWRAFEIHSGAEGGSGTIDGLYIHTNSRAINARGSDSWEASNVHLTGSGDLRAPDHWDVTTGSDAIEADPEPWMNAGKTVEYIDGEIVENEGDDDTDFTIPQTDSLLSRHGWMQNYVSAEDEYHELSLAASGESGSIQYVIHADVPMLADYEHPDLNANWEAGPSDRSLPNADGTWTAIGSSGGGGDTFRIYGDRSDIFAFNVEGNVDHFTVTWDGDEIDAAALIDESDSLRGSSGESDDDSYDEGYEAGRDSGLDEGYNKGYDDGYDDGTEEMDNEYESGYDDGYEQAKSVYKPSEEYKDALREEGENDGYEDGYHAAKDKYYEIGYEDAKESYDREDDTDPSEAYDEGYEDGYEDGYGEGKYGEGEYPGDGDESDSDRDRYEEGYDDGYADAKETYQNSDEIAKSVVDRLLERLGL